MYRRPPLTFGLTNQIGSIVVLPAPGVGFRLRITHLWASPRSGAAFASLALSVQDGADIILWVSEWGGAGGVWTPASIVFPEPGLPCAENAVLKAVSFGGATTYDIGGGYFIDAV